MKNKDDVRKIKIIKTNHMCNNGRECSLGKRRTKE
jgi:hypothetical protein